MVQESRFNPMDIVVAKGNGNRGYKSRERRQVYIDGTKASTDEKRLEIDPPDAVVNYP